MPFLVCCVQASQTLFPAGLSEVGTSGWSGAPSGTRSSLSDSILSASTDLSTDITTGHTCSLDARRVIRLFASKFTERTQAQEDHPES